MMKKAFWLIAMMGLMLDVWGQAPKYSNEFLAIGVGARGLAMGNTCVASADDITAGYWNPAGLAGMGNNSEVGAMHAEYFAGIASYDYIGLAIKPNETSAIGISYLRFGVDNIPNTLELIDEEGNIRYDRITSFSVADNALLFSYASQLGEVDWLGGGKLLAGGNFKIIRRVAGDFASAWGFGLDAAAKFKAKEWLFGAVLRDATSTFNAWSFNTGQLEEVFVMTGNELPQNSLELTLPRLLLGAGYQFPIYGGFGGLAETGLDMTTDGKRNVMIKTDLISIDPHLGLEFNYNKIVFVRGGFGNFQTIPTFDNKTDISFQPNIGIGVQYKNLAIDYALTDIGDQSIALYSNVFSLRYSFNRKEMAKFAY